MYSFLLDNSGFEEKDEIIEIEITCSICPKYLQCTFIGDGEEIECEDEEYEFCDVTSQYNVVDETEIEEINNIEYNDYFILDECQDREVWARLTFDHDPLPF